MLWSTPKYWLGVRGSFAYIFPKIQEKNQGIHENTFAPPQASVSARSHLETLPGALLEGTLELEGFYINIIAPPMTRE